MGFKKEKKCFFVCLTNPFFPDVVFLVVKEKGSEIILKHDKVPTKFDILFKLPINKGRENKMKELVEDLKYTEFHIVGNFFKKEILNAIVEINENKTVIKI